MDKLGDFVSRQKWLRPVETVLGALADSLFLKNVPLGEKVRNLFRRLSGGHLVYNERIGVNHAPEELPDKFVPVMKESELGRQDEKAEADGFPSWW